MKTQRRDFLKNGSIAFVSLAMLTRAAQSGAQAKAKALPHQTEADAMASALGYRNDAKTVDRAKYPAFKPGTDCDDCVQFEGKKGETWGPCKIFPGKAVNMHGWCSAFQPKKA